MPRCARIDIPGLLQHVIVKGSGKSDIFTDEHDRRDFVGRFSRLLESTGTECLAWALMPDHFHLLLRVGETPLSIFMRRLLTGYAVSFNHRRERSGPLFRNRYKSIVCDEDEYLVELVRYIHLNPLRSGAVATAAELEEYPWSGHSVILGENNLSGQNVHGVLSRFGSCSDDARRSYRIFVRNGIGQGRRDELGGGRDSRRDRDGDNGQRDLRLLGDDEFVQRVMGDAGLKNHGATTSLDGIIEAVLSALGLEEPELLSRGRRPMLAEARALICHTAFMGGHHGVAIADRLNISGAAVTIAARRGREAIKKYPELSL